MNAKTLFDTNFPLGTTETDVQQLVTGNEGFSDIVHRVFQKRGPSRQRLQQWIETNLERGQIPDVTKEGTVEIGKVDGAFFLQAGTPPNNLLAAVKENYNLYRKLVTRYQGTIHKNCKILNRIRTEAGNYLRSNKNDADEALKLVYDWQGRIGKTALDEFSEPSGVMLGYGTDAFVVNDVFKGMPTIEKADGSVTVPVITDTEAKALGDIVKGLLVLGDSVITVAENHPGYDASESPFSELPDQKRSDLPPPKYTQPTFEEENTDLFYNIGHRCERLAFALTAYLMAITD